MTIQDASKRMVGRYFSLLEFLRSDKAYEHGLESEQLAIPDEYIRNIELLCKNVLDPLRVKFGPVIIKSGYRGEKLNGLVKGSPSSQHTKGMAADIVVHPMANAYMYIARYLPFDQLINEYDYSWIHVSYNDGNNRYQLLSITKNGTRHNNISNINSEKNGHT